MNAEEAYEYIQTNNLECATLNVLLFNNLDFYFMPLWQPGLTLDKPGSIYISSKGEYNYLSSDYCNLTFALDGILDAASKIYNHPEHLIGFMLKYQNQIEGCIKYYKKRNDAEAIRNSAIYEFLRCIEEDDTVSLSIDYIDEMIEKSRRIRNVYKRKNIDKALIVDQDILFDEKLNNYISSEMKIYKKNINEIYVHRLWDIQSEMSFGRCSLIKPEVFLTGEHKPDTLWFYADVVSPQTIHTNLDENVSIIDSKDNIPNILFELSIRLNANVLKIATGYLYDSGLQLLEPTLNTISNRNGDISFFVGALQHYPKSSSNFNRETAKLVNEFAKSQRINNLFTYSDRFFHGKVYYIANDEEAYVIIGSSNVTYSAYFSNYEFNIVHHIKSMDDVYFSWFKELEDNSQKIDYLNEDIFNRNIIQDERGTKKGSNIVKRLTSEEQMMRYKCLQDYQPSQIYEYCFQSIRGFKPFKKYSAFQYEEKGLFVLEAFDFGNACYILKGISLKDIKDKLKNKSKMEIQEEDYYCTHIEHDKEYESIIYEMLCT